MERWLRDFLEAVVEPENPHPSQDPSCGAEANHDKGRERRRKHAAGSKESDKRKSRTYRFGSSMMPPVCRGTETAAAVANLTREEGDEEDKKGRRKRTARAIRDQYRTI